MNWREAMRALLVSLSKRHANAAPTPGYSDAIEAARREGMRLALEFVMDDVNNVVNSMPNHEALAAVRKWGERPALHSYVTQRPYYELEARDVGMSTITAFGRIWQTSYFIGRVLPGDVGKRVYWVGNQDDGILQVENDAQFAARLGADVATRSQS